MNTPIFSHLKKYHGSGRISFAMPGHKNGRGLNPELLDCDVTELPATLDLHSKCDVVKSSLRLLSERYGSDESYIVTCGSTACIQAMLAAALKPGDTLLAAADCHISVINTCALCGFNLRFLPKTLNREFLIPEAFKDIDQILDKYDDIKAVIITSPTYYGICADIPSVLDLCHRHSIPLLVDEAHGAHFPASPLLPDSASLAGADAVCQSAHKTLNALTGAAFLHVNGNLISRTRLKAALSMFQTSSPSYVIAASADLARDELYNNKNWSDIFRLCIDFKKKIRQNTDIHVLDNDDCTRLVLNFSEYNTTGCMIEKILCGYYNIDIEMSDLENIVLIVTASSTADDLDALYSALLHTVSRLQKSQSRIRLEEPPVCADLIQPQTVFFSESYEICLSDAAGYISAVSVCAYPPGIPIIAAGSRITKEQTEYLKQLDNAGARITGLNKGLINVI